nr:unnamed protein product [Callosobruchus analis]
MAPQNKILRRKIGGRPYRPYSDRNMDLCIQDITRGNLTQRQAAEKYKIPRSSIILKLKAIRQNNVNLPGQEKGFVDHVIIMCKFGFPITVFDLRYIVKTYLDSQDRKVKEFNNNFPGKRWAECFLERQRKELSQRFCSNIKRVRASVNEDVINSFFCHLESEIKDISRLIYNYDETNLVDDPGKKKVLAKRGCKYPEAIKNSTKAAVSIMVCGNAAGEILPLYVNYKAEKMWDTWTEGGPPNTRYNRSKSGWFDGSSFEDWFFSIVLPVLKKKDGKKVLIGDNLSSHISMRVLEACHQYNIAFIALPPNSTHLTQPLDVAFFRPFKSHWRKILDKWKMTPDGQRLPTIPKNVFPSLLLSLWNEVLLNSEANIKSGFTKTGIYPLCKEKVLERLPSYSQPGAEQANTSSISDAFKKFLEDTRKEAIGQTGMIKRRKKKLNVPPGKSISAEEVENMNLLTSPKKTGPSKRRRLDSSSEESSDNYSLASSSSLNISDSEHEDATENKENSPHLAHRSVSPKEGQYVVVVYEGEYWPGQVVHKENQGAFIKCMERCGKLWKWPEKEDCIFIPKKILCL